MPNVQGVDVSHYQGIVNWMKLRRSGAQFTAIKATEGLNDDFKDKRFPFNWPQAKRAGLFTGAYHFLDASEDGAEQADYLHSYVREHGHFIRGDFVLLDVETLDGQDPAGVINCAASFVQRAQKMIDKQVMIYTGKWFWDELGNPPAGPVLSKCPLWLSAYGQPQAPNPVGGWPLTSFWQYSSTGKVPGIAGEVDLDLFLGDLSQLKAVLKWA